ncbi:MAG: chemotaxis-specific protein-glutamate methyltransferase CheB [Ignavibacteria bacterium]
MEEDLKKNEYGNSSKPIVKVLIVEDSLVMQELLLKVFSSEPRIYVMGCVRNGREAIEFVKKKKPDVITMDINMPVMNGFLATREIMETTPVPIIIVSETVNPKDVNDTFRSLQAGAVSIESKPGNYGTDKYHVYEKELCRKVLLMSEIKVIRRINFDKTKTTATVIKINISPDIYKGKKIVAVGASTGGPIVIEKILSSLSRDFPLPIVIVQHITAGFTQGLVDWLNSTSVLPVSIAVNNEQIQAGRCYFAPDGMHLKIGAGGRLILSGEPPVNNLRPSVSMLFSSVAEVYESDAIGILLTGMGHDGAEDLAMMKNAGAVTIAQDQSSSVIFGMPGEAVKLGGSLFVLPPEDIITLLNWIKA